MQYHENDGSAQFNRSNKFVECEKIIDIRPTMGNWYCCSNP